MERTRESQKRCFPDVKVRKVPERTDSSGGLGDETPGFGSGVRGKLKGCQGARYLLVAALFSRRTPRWGRAANEFGAVASSGRLLVASRGAA